MSGFGLLLCNRTLNPILYRRSPEPWDGDATALQSKQRTD
jgi:hypothetical protein